MSDDKAAVQPASDESDSENPAKTPENTQEKADFSNGVNGDAAELEAGIAEQIAEGEAGSHDVPESGGESVALAGLQAELEKAQAKAEENMDIALRTRAEMENLRKRQSRELENAHKYALDKIAEELLPVRDTLELGVAAADDEQAELGKIVEGLSLIHI